MIHTTKGEDVEKGYRVGEGRFRLLMRLATQ
jgi:hypothetical protein